MPYINVEKICDCLQCVFLVVVVVFSLRAEEDYKKLVTFTVWKRCLYILVHTQINCDLCCKQTRDNNICFCVCSFVGRFSDIRAVYILLYFLL